MIQAWSADGKTVRYIDGDIKSQIVDGAEYEPPVRRFAEAGFVVSQPHLYKPSYVELCKNFLRQWG